MYSLSEEAAGARCGTQRGLRRVLRSAGGHDDLSGAIYTAASLRDAFTIYDASAGTGTGVVALGGPSATHPIGWWIQVPASAYAGSSTSTLTLTRVSGP